MKILMAGAFMSGTSRWEDVEKRVGHLGIDVFAEKPFDLHADRLEKMANE